MSELDSLYARIPKIRGCKTGCNDCCGPVPMRADEKDRVASIMRPAPYTIGDFVTPTKPCGTCAYSTAQGCSIYASRPFMCRLFGASVEAERLRCPHGARPKRPLSAAEADALTQEYIRLEASHA